MSFDEKYILQILNIKNLLALIKKFSTFNLCIYRLKQNNEGAALTVKRKQSCEL